MSPELDNTSYDVTLNMFLYFAQIPHVSPGKKSRHVIFDAGICIHHVSRSCLHISPCSSCLHIHDRVTRQFVPTPIFVFKSSRQKWRLSNSPDSGNPGVHKLLSIVQHSTYLYKLRTPLPLPRDPQSPSLFQTPTATQSSLIALLIKVPRFLHREYTPHLESIPDKLATMSIQRAPSSFPLHPPCRDRTSSSTPPGNP